MSFIDLLFPAAELEALGNKWVEPAPKRRRLESGTIKVEKMDSPPPQPPRRLYSTSALEQRHRLLSASSSSAQVPVSTSKRSLSDSLPTATSSGKSAATNATPARSGLPSFIEPSILKNYLHHLHPSDRSRYSLPNSPRSEEPTRSMGVHRETEEAVSSPGSLISDSASSPSFSDHCPTPSAGIVEQFRSGPFGHIFDGMRITDHERDMMEDLLSPFPNPLATEDVRSDASASKKRKEAPSATVEIASENYYEIDEALLRKMFPNTGTEEEVKRKFSFEHPVTTTSTNGDRDTIPRAQQEEKEQEEEEEEDKRTSPAGIVMYDYSVLSGELDDFFDLDEASTAV